MGEKYACESCRIRAKYDDNPSSFAGRLWLWHAGWCPRFSKYMSSLPDGQRSEMARHYGLKKYAA